MKKARSFALPIEKRVSEKQFFNSKKGEASGLVVHNHVTNSKAAQAAKFFESLEATARNV